MILLYIFGGFIMGILTRFKDIMAANINAVLDKLEDPAKMIDQLIREISDDLGEVKAETASVMAEEQRQKRALDECRTEIEKYQNYAIKAIESGNDDDAKAFLNRKNQLAASLPSLEEAYTLARDNATKMRQMHNKLENELNELDSRRSALKAKIAVAKTQEKLNKMGDSADAVAKGLSSFDRVEAKVDQMLDKANAMAELNRDETETLAMLEAKYDAKVTDVDNELAALKAQLGK